MPTRLKKDPICAARKAGRLDAAVRALIEDKQLPGALDLTDRVLQIRHPEDGSSRMRKVISRSKTRPTGKFPSRKNGRMNHWESPHELNAFRTLETDSTVLRFDEQPLEIVYLMNGVVRTHIPDVRVVRRCQTKELWEIKTAEDARDPEVERRTSIMVVGLLRAPRRPFAQARISSPTPPLRQRCEPIRRKACRHRPSNSEEALRAGTSARSTAASNITSRSSCVSCASALRLTSRPSRTSLA